MLIWMWLVMKRKSNKYKDMYFMERPFSKRRKMSMRDRAAQFAPFAALVGYQESVDETARVVEKKIILDDNIREIIDYKLQEILQDIELRPNIEIVYFVEDQKKDGGSYNNYRGTVKAIDSIEKNIVFYSGKVIAIDDIFSVEY